MAEPADTDGTTDQQASPALTFKRRGPSLRKVLRVAGRLINGATIAVVAIIALGIAFEVLGANDDKWIVSTVEDVGEFLAAPFDRMFTPDSNDLAVAINWGIAIAVYAVVGRLLAGLVARAANRAG